MDNKCLALYWWIIGHSLFNWGSMQKFKVSAWPKDSSKREYNPEWEVTISSNFTGEAIEHGNFLFQTHCAEHALESEDFEVRAGTL